MNETDVILDETDYRLILEIQDSPRRSYRGLAERLGVSESTVRRRLNTLIRSKVVSIAAVPDPFKLGYQVVAFIGLHVHPSNIDAIGKRLVALPNIHYVSLCSGDVDFMIWGYFANTGKLADFIANELGQIPGIIKTETMMQLRFLKRSLGVGTIDMANAGIEAAHLNPKRLRRKATKGAVTPVASRLVRPSEGKTSRGEKSDASHEGPSFAEPLEPTKKKRRQPAFSKGSLGDARAKTRGSHRQGGPTK